MYMLTLDDQKCHHLLREGQHVHTPDGPGTVTKPPRIVTWYDEMTGVTTFECLVEVDGEPVDVTKVSVEGE